ncbi:MAG: aldo/keto reductase [Pseudomonadota bacterium]
MERRALGRTGISVSTLCFGTMSFGGEADVAASSRLYAACREAGIDFFDCAATYNGGRSEEILGRLISAERDAITLTTKCGYGTTGAKHGQADREGIIGSVEASLRRLGTDRIDLLFLHRHDPSTHLDETLRTLDDMVTSGKVLHLGVSNWAAWQVARALGRAEAEGWARFEALQPMYNLVKRQAEVELLPMALAEGMAVTPYSPLGGGLLTGKYVSRGDGRLTQNARYAERYAPDRMHQTAADLAELAGREGLHPATLAVAWVNAHPAVTAPILGARSVEQLRPSLDAATLSLPDELMAEVTALSETPPPATDRLEEASPDRAPD